jgi:hypothetical protein
MSAADKSQVTPLRRFRDRKAIGTRTKARESAHNWVMCSPCLLGDVLRRQGFEATNIGADRQRLGTLVRHLVEIPYPR